MSHLPARTNEVKQLLGQSHKQVKSLLQDEKRAAKFTATALTIATDSKLSNCSPQSIVSCCIGAAALNLNIDRNIGQVYVVPYNGAAQLQIGYRGYIALLNRMGWAVKAKAVYSVDDFDYEFDVWDEKITFKPDFDNRHLDNTQWVTQNLEKVFTVAKSPDGELFIDIMSAEEIEKVRHKSPNQSGKPSGIWLEWYEAMAIKSAIKRHVKRLPIGDEAHLAVAIDEAPERGKPVDARKSVESGSVIDAEFEPDQPQHSTDLNVMLMPPPPHQPQKQPTKRPGNTSLLDAMLKRKGVEDIKGFKQHYKIETAEQERDVMSDQAGFEQMIEAYKALAKAGRGA